MNPRVCQAARPGQYDICVSDLEIRHRIYQFFADECRAPLAEDIANLMGLPITDVRLAFRRLHDRHMIFVEPASGEIRMANPFSAIATDYRVTSGHRTWWANCAWDTLGIAAALGIDVEIETRHPMDAQRLALRVVNGALNSSEHLVYFPLPCRRWYDDLVYT